jgi:oligoendopeptidase F
MRPWDTMATPADQSPLKPFTSVKELSDRGHAIFQQVDPALGGYYRDMMAEDLLDLDNRKGKAPGGYCTSYEVRRKPFIFMNAVGVHDDVQTLLHEGGHAFHVYESAGLPYMMQREVNTEFCEVASMAMELLASPYLAAESGGYYSASDAARARIEHMEKMILFWPYMAIVDQFQNWVYDDEGRARNFDTCDAAWLHLSRRFSTGVDWNGLEDIECTGWHRKLHIYQVPLYYVEYGLAQLGAVHVFANSLNDHAGAVAAYRHALSLGGTRSLPDLFSAAGAKFRFDRDGLREAVDVLESTMEALLPIARTG